MTTTYDALASYARQVATLGSIAALASWDQETYMPKAAVGARSEQAALLASLLHERLTSAQMGDLIAACEADTTIEPGSARAASVREFRRDYDLETKLPAELVEELARTGAKAQEAWKDARERSDFNAFKPWLEQVIGLTRRKAECYGTPHHADGSPGEPYDALLNLYEPGATAAEIEAVFTPLGQRLGDLIAQLRAGTPPDESILGSTIPADRQHAFGMFVIKQMGFDTNAGRLDTTTHPFCEGLAPGDTRLTTRYRDERFTDALYGTMHECGHGLYEQGLPKGDHFGEPLGDSVSLGIHESQSRMWENFVGRSKPFWTWALPHAKTMLGGAIADATVDQLYAAVNTANPSFIRVEADEATYNLHVMVRFEMERALFSGQIEAGDVPGLWNETYERYLGLKVPDDKHGCLQDVHWSFGLLGYFPTYTLGNLYAAQFWEQINRDIPDLDDQMARGEFAALLGWLRTNIHQHGRRYRAAELCERATGKPLSADPLLRHLEGRLRPNYGV